MELLAYIVMAENEAGAAPISIHLDHDSAKALCNRSEKVLSSFNGNRLAYDYVWIEKVPLCTTGEILKQTALKMVK